MRKTKIIKLEFEVDDAVNVAALCGVIKGTIPAIKAIQNISAAPKESVKAIMEIKES